MSMPKQKPHRSKQDYGTPREFLAAVRRDFGDLDIDLAARADNKVCELFVSPEQDTLSVSWRAEFPFMQGWLNPEFSNIRPYAAKCGREGGPDFRIIMLTPASVSTEWFADHVHEQAAVLFIRPRLTFKGTDAPYPKDLMLTLWGFGHTGYDTWRWDN